MWGSKLRSLSMRMRKEEKRDGYTALPRNKLCDGEQREEEVPKGYLAVYVGEDLRRFVIPASYLCQPVFRTLMEKVAEEFGFQQTGGLRIPCNEDVFEEILVVLEETTSKSRKKKKNRLSRYV
ncbi:hypothetical protein J5N97_026710 [Dioscorea zingiberensis]|uniref:Small auxin up regulated protein n=1 Tax=Dioscorea zingiberensis TaxID=325984 RepID=A0A9D5C2Q9_9LILI|nr:hypothetical protein J5N97_026710 [Dioscorea zingiberensis]